MIDKKSLPFWKAFLFCIPLKYPPIYTKTNHAMTKNYSIVLIAFLTIASLSFFSYTYLTTDPGRIAIKPDAFDEQEEGGAAKQEEILARMEQERLMTQDPSLGYAPVERLKEAELKAQQSVNNFLKENSPQALLSWTERGPNNMGGRSRSVLINRNDATGNTVFVGSVGGGLWKTTNFKSGSPTWTMVSSVSANLAISCLAQDPSNFNIMYAGTGEGFGNSDAIRGLGIYKSTDGGNTWSLLASTTTGGTNVNDFGYVQDIVVYSNGTVYASGLPFVFCNRGGVLKSTNGGTSWTRVVGALTGGDCTFAHDFYAYDLEISASGDIYATTKDGGTGGPSGKIWKSPAGATVGDVGTWTNITPAPKAGGFWQRIDVACAPNNNNVVYAMFQGNGNGVDSIMRSDDAGANWINVDNTTNWCDQGSTASGVDFTRGQAWYDLILAVKPDDAATVFAGGVDVMKTTNSGGLWSQLTQWSSGCGSPTPLPNIHADIHNIVFFPTGLGTTNEFIVVNDGGIYYSSDGGASFTNKSTGYNTIQYYAGALHPTAGSNYMLAGAQDNGSHKFNSAGLNSVTTATGGDGGFCHIDDDPTYQITSFTYASFGYTRDGGSSFGSITFPTNVGRFITPSDWDNTANSLYAPYTNGRLLRMDGVVAPVGSPTPSGFQEVITTTSYGVSALKVDPNTPNRVWVGFSTASGASSQNPQLWYVDGANDFGTNTSTQVTVPPALVNVSTPTGAYISSLDVENGNANHLLMTVSNYGMTSVWESTDLGATWTSVEGNLPDMPVRWGVFIPSGFGPGSGVNAIGGVLLATELGVWSTPALNPGGPGTTTWTQNAGAMGNIRVDMLKIRSSDKTVVAATHGRGLFTTTLVAAGLPVNFTAFTGKAEEKQNRLFWNVENEVNNKGYEIQRKYKNEQNFTKIGFVPAKSANASANEYTFPDALVDLGIDNVAYRLKQVDIDGHFKYSPVVNLTRKISGKFVEYIAVRTGSLLIRMNSSNNNSQMINFRLFDNSGKLLKQQQLQQRTQEVSMVGLPRGVFVVELSAADGRKYTQKIAY